MGLFEHPMPPAEPSAVGSEEDRSLAATAVAESAVLLRTRDGLLPLAVDPKAGPILLAGAAADDMGTQLGGWSITWQGSTGPTTPGTTLRAALADRLGARLRYAADGAFAAGTHATSGIVVVAEPPYAEGRGDSATLELAPTELQVIDAVRPHVDRLIVVIYSGRPVLLDGLAGADAVVAAWLPGTEAEGLAAVLVGDEPFHGTTPYTWPVTADDAPRTGKGACDGAVFPLGYGLVADGSRLGPAACPTP
jgi:beta-glucosidase